MTAPPLMRSRIVGHVLAYVRSRDGDPNALVREFALPATAEKDDEVVMPLATLHAFLDAAERAADDPNLGIHVAQKYRRGLFGIMEYASRSAPDLREAMQRIVRFASLMNDLVVMSLEEQDGKAKIQQRVPTNPLCLGRHANEFFVATLLDQAQLLTGVRSTPERIWFAHAKPRRIDELVATFGTDEITWSAEANGIEVDAKVLDLPLLTSDPPLLDVLDKSAETALEARPAAPDLVAQVRRAVRDLMRSETPTIDSVARELRSSPRTLQRRLGAEGTSFNKVLESVREELARAWVGEGKLGLADIALRLGYADTTAFSRAFKRWTGKTPKDFRGP